VSAVEETWGESPFSEAPISEDEWGSPFAPAEAWTSDLTGEAESHWGGESEWGSPFAPATEATYETEAPWSPEAEAPWSTETEWGMPFAPATGAESWFEDEAQPPFPNVCSPAGAPYKDVTFPNQTWKFPPKPRGPREGDATIPPLVLPRIEWFQTSLRAFDVDDYRLKTKHHEALRNLAQRLKDGVASGRLGPGPVYVGAYGSTSTTGADLHNLALSRHRAYNAANFLRCEIQRSGVKNPIVFGLLWAGEEEARVTTPNNTETDVDRSVIVRVWAPLPECQRCQTCPRCRPPHRPPHQRKTPRLCVSVPRVAPRKTSGLPPDIIPLGPLVPGLRMPFAIVVNGNATVKVDDQASGRSGEYAFKGWGLEVALPAGRTVVDLRADLRASLDVLVRASASLSAKLQLGPLGLALRIDASAFARLVVKLVAQLRLRLEIDLGRPNVPELIACRPMQGRAGPAGFAFDALAGPAFLLVPGRGFGPAVVSFGGPRVASTGLSAAPIPVPSDKSTVKTLLALGGEVRLIRASGGSAGELETFEDEWEQPFGETEQYGYETDTESGLFEVESESPFQEALPTYEDFAAELPAFA
jgi:outer membrane protein OmpA-like peptidoglycan-associated protein